jgi:hypothetical protein
MAAEVMAAADTAAVVTLVAAVTLAAEAMVAALISAACAEVGHISAALTFAAAVRDLPEADTVPPAEPRSPVPQVVRVFVAIAPSPLTMPQAI